MPPEKLTERLITVFDVETTGLDTQTSRVVQFGHADFRSGALLRLNDAMINPCTPIPTAASEIHKIYDSDVVDAPTFGMASKVYEKRVVDAAPFCTPAHPHTPTHTPLPVLCRLAHVCSFW